MSFSGQAAVILALGIPEYPQKPLRTNSPLPETSEDLNIFRLARNRILGASGEQQAAQLQCIASSRRPSDSITPGLC